MGYILERTPEMGEYGGEVRRESFYLAGEKVEATSGDQVWDDRARHGIIVYPLYDGAHQGMVEILIEDIPKIRAVLDAVERRAAER